jgi:putative transposase
MKYNPEKHHRRSMRLKGYDYSAAGAYFITLCTYQRQCLFGEIMDGAMHLNPYGKIANDCLQAIPEHFARFQLDEFVMMPNHVHAVLRIVDDNDKRRGMALPCPYNGEFGKPMAGSLPIVIGAFKSAVTKRINILRDTPGTPVWQRNYHERIIRDELALNNIRRYIQMNPINWKSDRFHQDQ